MLQLYRFLTAVLACTGCVGLVISGEINLFMSMTGIGLLPGYYRFLKGISPAPQWIIGGCSVLTLLIFFLDSLFISSDYFVSVAHLTITFQAIKSFDLKEPWDNLQVYFMALLQLIIASELMYSITFGVIFIVFLVVFVTAIVFSHFMKEGAMIQVDIKKPVFYISLLTLIITVAFFISIPRISGGIWSKGHIKRIKSVGFSEKVQLGSFGEFKLDPRIIMRVELNPLVPEPYYWRGMTLDYFDGKSWNSTRMKTRRAIKKIEGEFVVQPASERLVEQKIMLEPIDSDIIFGLDRIVSVKGRFLRLEKDPAMSLFVWRKGSKRIQYIVKSNIDKISQLQSVDLLNRERYQSIPDSLQDQIKILTDTILKSERTGPLSDLKKAQTIERYLKDNYRYSLNIKTPYDTISPILHFLFQSKTGFCEHYATAMTLMLRSAGIPARIVTGFVGGELNTYGGYIIVRQSNAHSWVEAVINGSWQRFDPTPSVLSQPPSSVSLYLDMLKLMWDRYVIAFSLSDQKEIVKAVSIPFMMPKILDFRLRLFSKFFIGILFIVTILGTAFLLKRVQLKRYGFVTEHYVTLQKVLKRKGAAIKPCSTPSALIREAVQLGVDQSIIEFIKLYEEYRFGRREMRREGRAKYQNLMKEIKRQLRQ